MKIKLKKRKEKLFSAVVLYLLWDYKGCKLKNL